ncbi:MAG: rod-binding protein [Alphaproteobacteria bacterium]|nr:rod-binding protein [Alphaproteobacteria bacterium]
MTDMINIFDDAGASRLNFLTRQAQKSKAESAAEDFEAFFLTRMLESMFDGVSTDGLFGGGHAEKVYRSLLLDQYGKEMARMGGIGVKDYVMQAMLALQEENSAEQIAG